MQDVSVFHKVSFDQFLQDSKTAGFVDNETSPEIVKIVWENLKLPITATKRQTYHFFLPYSFYLCPDKTIIVPTGINRLTGFCQEIKLTARPCLEKKHGMKVETIYNNEHILAKISVESNLCLSEGDKFARGILY